MAGVVLDTGLLYGFMRRLLTPFNNTDAFRLGLIDANGKRLRSPKTPEEVNVDRPFDRVVLNLKRMIAKVGGGNMTTAAIALFLLREQNIEKFYDRPDLLQEAFDHAHLASKFYPNVETIIHDTISEDAPVNAVGGGAIAGLGVGAQGEPGVKRFAGVRLFDVKSNKFHKAIKGKKKFSNFKHWVETEDAEDVKTYAAAYPKRPILVRNAANGVEMMFLRRGKSKSLAFHEAAGQIRYWVARTRGSTDWRIIRTNNDLRDVHPDWEIRGPYGDTATAQAHRSVDRSRDDMRYAAAKTHKPSIGTKPATKRS
jgi:hypothetical protein